MKRLSLIVATAWLAACADQPTEPVAAIARGHSVTSGASERFIVQFDNTGIPPQFASTVSALGGSVEALYPEIGGALVTELSASAVAQLRVLTGVTAVESDHKFKVEALTSVSIQAATDVTASAGGNPARAAIFARQWNMRQIHAEAAWANGRLGSRNVKVAILDTGLDPSNPDLAGKIDEANSASFVGWWEEMVREYYFPGSPSWIDMHYHGTHVGATVSSNAVIAAGVTVNTTLMAVKVIDVDGYGLEGSVLAGIMWSVYRGADVINLSLGSSFFKSSMPGYVSLINRAINYANSMGVTVVAAAGNEGRDLDHNWDEFAAYCNAPNVICVAATGPPDEFVNPDGPWSDPDASAYYTNYGRSSISVAAPGGNGGTGVSAICSRYSLIWPECGTGNYILNAQGTSMAAAHVAGLAALLVEKHGRNPGKIRSAIQKGAADLGPRGADPRYGKGRIDVLNSLGS
jgi:lantibiotic leader peptide-processing serine protease